MKAKINQFLTHLNALVLVALILTSLLYDVRKVLQWPGTERPPTGTIRNNNKDKTDNQEQSTNNLGLQTYKLGGVTDYLLQG